MTTKNLEQADKNTLQFRPNIQFVEPDIEPQAPNPIEIPNERLQLEDVEAGREKLKLLAESINTLAGAIQSRADDRAKNMQITLDPLVDQDAIQAMRRHFPEEDPSRITYAQYKHCKENMRLYGESVGRQGLITPKDVADRVASRDNEESSTNIGGYNTASSKTGGLRPELDPKSRIIQPIDLEKLQINLICILINFIWKNFLKPLISNAAPPVSWAFNALPDQVCDPGGGIQIPDLFILGNQPPKILTGEAIPKIPTSAPEF